MNKEKQEDRGQKVNGDIDKMVTKHIIFAKIVVEGKSKTRYRSVNPLFVLKKRFPDFLPTDFCEVYCLSIQNVLLVIKMPGGMKGIGIDTEDDDKE